MSMLMIASTILSSLLAAAPPTDLLTPWMTEDVIVVAYADMDRAPVGEAMAWMAEQILQVDAQFEQPLSGDIEQGRQAAKAWREAFLSAGGRELATVISFIPRQRRTYQVVLVTLDEQAGPDAAEAVAPLLPELELQERGERHLVFVPRSMEHPGGNEKTRPADADKVAAAFSAVGDAPVWAVLVPGAGFRQMLRDEVQQLPPQLGGGPIDPLVNIAWAQVSAASISPPALRGEAVTASVDDAEATLNILRRAAEPNDAPLGQAEKMMLQVLVSQLAVDGRRLVLDLPAAQLGEVLRGPLASALIEARKAARQVQRMSNLRQLGVAVLMYADNHDDRFPATLNDLAPYFGDVAPQLMEGVSYRRPAEHLMDVEEPSQTVMLHTQAEPWPERGVGVGFLDGHVEWIADEARFRQLTKQ